MGVTAALVLAVGSTSHAAPKPAAPLPVTILSIAWTTLVTTKKVGKKVVNVPIGMQVKMTLSGAPQMNTIYRVTTATADCTTFWLNYSDMADGDAKSSLQHNCPGFTVPATSTSSTESVPLEVAKVDATSITWTVPASMFPKAIKVGTQISSLSGHSRFYPGTTATGGATVPQIDEAAGDGVYKYGK